MKSGRTVGTIEKGNKFTPAAMIAGSDPEAMDFAKLITVRACQAEIEKRFPARRGVAWGISPSLAMAQSTRLARIGTELERWAALGDAQLAGFLKRVAALIKTRAHKRPVADLPRLMLEGITRKGGPFNVSRLVDVLKDNHGIEVSHRWVAREIKALGRPVGKVGRPRFR